jgi:hypothetical protein
MDAQKPKLGRPKKIVWDQRTMQELSGLGQIIATEAEAASFFGVSVNTLKRFFAEHPDAREAFENGKNIGKISLRRLQMKMAAKNPAMAIFLGKNLLGQSDRVAHFGGGPGDGPIQYENLTEEEINARLEALLAPGAKDKGAPSGTASGGAGADGSAGRQGKAGRGRKAPG